MKNVSTFLLIVLLGSACLGSMSFATATSQTNSVATSTTEIQPAYTGSGYLDRSEVDYWWILNVTKGDFVVVSIGAESAFYEWESLLYYDSNFTTEIDRISEPDNHVHSFVANETGDYLLRLYTNAIGFNYAITCTHNITEQLMYAEHGYLDDSEVDHWRIFDISNGDTLLVSVCAESAFYGWESRLYDPGKQIGGISEPDTHIYEIVANETGDYLLVLSSDAPINFSYTVKCTHMIRDKEETNIAFSMRPNPSLVGQTVSLLGNLTTSDGDPIPGEQVTIKANGTARGNLTTNSTGWFKASGQVKSAGTFNITVEYAGSMQYLPSSDWEILVVNKAETSIYAVFVPNPVNSGENCTLKGVLLDQSSNPLRFAKVTLEYSTDYGSTWNPAGTLTTNSYGIFSKTFTAPSPRIILVRTSYTGSPSYESSSAVISLIVR